MRSSCFLHQLEVLVSAIVGDKVPLLLTTVTVTVGVVLNKVAQCVYL